MAAFFDGRADMAGERTFGARDEATLEATLVVGRCGLVGSADLRAVLRVGFGVWVLRDLGTI
jgi:hypothetical protein